MTDSLSEPLARLNAAQRRIKIDERHRYHLNLEGETWLPVQGVTTTIGVMAKPGLEKWKVNEQLRADIAHAHYIPPFPAESLIEYENRFRSSMGRERAGDRLANEAAKTGTEIHGLAEAHLRERLGLPFHRPTTSDKAANAFEGFLRWYGEAPIVPVAMERKVFHTTHLFAGTFDLLAYYDGRLTLIDFKTSVGDKIYAEHRLQSGAYRGALVEEFGFPEELDAMIVKINRETGEVLPLKIEDPPEGWRPSYDAFLHALALSVWNKANSPAWNN